MAGSTYGTLFKITTWGESHGKALGVVIDGCPAGLPLSEADIQPYLDRRKPGQSSIATPRKEDDTVEILSGVFDGKTTGTPISLMVRNTSQRSADYSEIASYYRPGHADYTFDEKYGFRDYRGGGRSSGRETIGRVAAGAVAMKILKEMGITVTAYTLSIGPVSADLSHFDKQAILETPTAMPDREASEKAEHYLKGLMQEKDSSGGVMECLIEGMPAGIGDPVFEKLSANLCKAIASIGAVKAVEIGDGILVSHSTGSQNNDAFCSQRNQPCRRHPRRHERRLSHSATCPCKAHSFYFYEAAHREHLRRRNRSCHQRQTRPHYCTACRSGYGVHGSHHRFRCHDGQHERPSFLSDGLL